MKAVILAGGLGTRLKPFTDVIPKPLIPLSGEQTLLEIQIHRLKKYGFGDIFIATNYKADLIESYLGDGSKYGVNLTFSRESKALGTCGPLTLLEENLNEPFLMMNGDILTSADLRKLYDSATGQNTILCVATKAIVRPFHFGNVIVEENRVVEIAEKPNLEFTIVAGIYVLRPRVFKYIPEDTYFGIDELIRTLLAAGEPISSYSVAEYWIDIGQTEDLEQATEAFKSGDF